MPAEIEDTYKQSFRTGLTIKFQQRQSKLRRICRTETVTGERTSFDRISPVESQTLVGRNQVTTYSETPMDRRWLSTERHYKAEPIDKIDKLKTIGDPTGPIIENFVAGINRKTDRIITTAALGTAYTGETGTTGVALPVTAAYAVAVDYVESGGAANSNLTIGKLRKAAYVLGNSEILGDMAERKRYFVCTWSQIRSLLTRTEVTSSDYNTVKALVDGSVNSFMGFEFLVFGSSANGSQYDVVPFNSGTERSCFACVEGALLYGVQEELFTSIDVLPQMNYSTQAYARRQDGAVRFWEEGVCRVLCDEAVV